MSRKRQVIIIGLDGADFGLLEREMAAGRLPTLRRLLEEGARGPLRSTVPPLTFPAWVTFATGVNPGRHGIFDFAERIPGSYGIRFVNARWRREPCFWQTLSAQGFRVAVVGVPVTYPPEPVNGVLVCGFDAPGVGGGRVDRSSVYPPEFFEELVARFPDYWLGANVVEFGDDYERIGRRLVQVLETRLEALLWLYQREDWDCFVGVIGETDAVCHYFWRFYDPDSPFHPPAQAELGGYVSRVYELVDSFLERLEEVRAPDSVLMLVSDHGMGAAGRTAVRLNAYLAERGFLSFRKTGLRHRALAVAKALGLRYVPPFIKRFLFRHTGLVNLVEGELRFGHLDWSRTLAYSGESPQFPSVYLNVRGRDPEGRVAPGDYERVAREVCEALEELSVGGRRLVERAYLREEVYRGPLVERAPDILLEWRDDLPAAPPLFLRSAPGAPPVEEAADLSPALLVNRTACHRPLGIFVAHGEGVRRGQRVSASLMDIAPTVMALVSGKGSPAYEGRVLTEVFADLAPPPTGDADRPGPRGEGGEHMTPEEEQAIKTKLRSLGYL